MADNLGNIQQQRFDAFGVSLGRRVISTCPKTPEPAQCVPSPPQAAPRGCADRLATGELGYHGQEGYRTRHSDAYRLVPLPTHERPNGSIFDGEQPHPEFDPAHPAGYETASTGFIMVGAREYDPEIGRFLQPDPRPTGPELQWGQLNQWAYCANDPVNASDPSGRLLESVAFAVGAGVGLALGAYSGYELAMKRNLGSVLGAVLAIMVGLLGPLMLDMITDACQNRDPRVFGSAAAFFGWLRTALTATGLAAMASFLLAFAAGLFLGLVVGFNLGVVAGSAMNILGHASANDGLGAGSADMALAHSGLRSTRTERFDDKLTRCKPRLPSCSKTMDCRRWQVVGRC